MNLIQYIKNQFGLLIKSFNLTKFLYIVVINLVASFILFLSWKGFEKVLVSLGQEVQDLNLESLQNLEFAQSANVNASLHSVVSRLYFYMFILILTLLVLWVVSQLTNWLIIRKSHLFRQGFARINFAYLKFLLFNLLWFVIWLLPLLFAFGLVYQTAMNAELYPVSRFILLLMAFLIFAFFFYITLIAYYYFSEDYKIGKSLGKAFSIGFGKIYYFIVPAIISFLIMMLMGLVSMPFGLFLPDSVFTWLTYVIYLAHSAWMCLFFARILAKLDKKAVSG